MGGRSSDRGLHYAAAEKPSSMLLGTFQSCVCFGVPRTPVNKPSPMLHMRAQQTHWFLHLDRVLVGILSGVNKPHSRLCRGGKETQGALATLAVYPWAVFSGNFILFL